MKLFIILLGLIGIPWLGYQSVAQGLNLTEPSSLILLTAGAFIYAMCAIDLAFGDD